MTNTTPGRPRRRRRAVVVTGAVAGALLIAALVPTVSIGFGAETRSVSVPGVREIVVDVGAGDVDLVGGSGTDVGVRSTLRGVFGAPGSRHEVRDGVLTISGACAGVTLGCAVDERVTVPPGVAVRLRAGAGDVRSTDLDVSRVTVDAGTADVSLSFRRPPDDVRVTVGTGDVVVRVPDVPYRVQVDAGVGGSSVTVTDDPDAPRSLSARSGVGHVSVIRV